MFRRWSVLGEDTRRILKGKFTRGNRREGEGATGGKRGATLWIVMKT